MGVRCTAKTSVPPARLVAKELPSCPKLAPDDASSAGGAAADGKETQEVRPAVWSSGVCFYPPSKKLWRIGRKWYDFEPFLAHHPGGAEVILLSRDRYEDATYAFESHHHNYARARKIIARYEVPAPANIAEAPPARGTEVAGAERCPELLDDDAFHSVLRKRLTEHLRKVGHPSGGPTRECCVFFWASFAAFVAAWAIMYATGWVPAAALFGAAAAILGAFGHNWVHQPQYRFWAYLSLDTIGFSSTGWFREHILQHHMYTNTPWDNHFKGTDPFLVTDPTVPRNWLQANVCGLMCPFFLTFGLWANYFAHLVETLKGNEEWKAAKIILPLNVALMLHRWGLVRGLLLSYTWAAVLGIWYFSCALMNHNAEKTLDVDARNKSRDWAEAQLRSSADWAVQTSFLRCWPYLWLNYHTVHHVFPRLDMSHHPAAQKLLMETCAEFGVHYEASHPAVIYKEMVRTFSTPSSLYQTILVHGA